MRAPRAALAPCFSHELPPYVTSNEFIIHTEPDLKLNQAMAILHLSRGISLFFVCFERLSHSLKGSVVVEHSVGQLDVVGKTICLSNVMMRVTVFDLGRTA
jgi:hypothetical protein